MELEHVDSRARNARCRQAGIHLVLTLLDEYEAMARSNCFRSFRQVTLDIDLCPAGGRACRPFADFDSRLTDF